MTGMDADLVPAAESRARRLAERALALAAAARQSRTLESAMALSGEAQVYAQLARFYQREAELGR